MPGAAGRAPAAARAQSLGEEVANAVSHGLGFLLAVASLPILVWTAARHGAAADVVGASIFAGTMVLLYLVSTVYHALPAGVAKRWLCRLDHAAIYVFIAGTYTPFTLGAMHGAWGWALFGVVWGMAAFGVTVKLLDRLQHPWVSTGLYVAMGWVVVVAAPWMAERIAVAGLAWLVAGGACYTLGAIVFLFDHRVRYAHFVFHVFVLAGSCCHFFAALWYARG
ncbi:MAG: hemolysin III family protein [Rubrivivax sp.]|nr:hemolysin III family protein [Rubrivivax sp.]